MKLSSVAPSVAALFVQSDGCYVGDSSIDAWPEARDARRYAGALPVVAHPPCQLWGAMAAVNFARWGGEHNRPGSDGGCFAAALAAVNRCGGVLEHPAASRAWEAHGLTAPRAVGWQRSGEGWVCEVWQSAYGHRANKATWLYYRGTSAPHELRWARPIGTHQIGFHDQRGKARNKPTLGKREANATPLEFREELLRLARLAGGHDARAALGVQGAKPQAGGEGSPPWGGGRGVGEPLPLGGGAGVAGQHPCPSATFGRGGEGKKGHSLAGAGAAPSDQREGDA